MQLSPKVYSNILIPCVVETEIHYLEILYSSWIAKQFSSLLVFQMLSFNLLLHISCMQLLLMSFRKVQLMLAILMYVLILSQQLLHILFPFLFHAFRYFKLLHILKVKLQWQQCAIHLDYVLSLILWASEVYLQQ